MKRFLIVMVGMTLSAVAETNNIPELLRAESGDIVKDVETWEKVRRPELLKTFLEREYGVRPVERPEGLEFDIVDCKEIYGGAAIAKTVKISFSGPGGSTNFNVIAVLPKSAEKCPVPSFILACNRDPRTNLALDTPLDFWDIKRIVARGYATLAFYVGDLTPDYSEICDFYWERDENNYTDIRGCCRSRWNKEGVFKVLEGPNYKRDGKSWGTLSAWAWGVSRVMDWIETEPQLDAKHVAVVGHSRGGKVAILSGVLDTRIAMVCSNDSGCSGAKLNHMALPKSESIWDIVTTFPWWFCSDYHQWVKREMEMPFDQHQLLALVAPRLLAVGSAAEDDWAGPAGELAAAKLASPAWELYGKKGLAADGWVDYHLSPGGHNLSSWDWQAYMDFADRHGWRKKTSKPKYVFLFIGDGMSSSQRGFADEFSRQRGMGPLAMNTMDYCALTRTCSASSLVTDSAAAATAIACGVKTFNGASGVDVNSNNVESCASVAHRAGAKVGIITTVPITHATPAGFYAHNVSRNDSYGIALDLANSGFEYFAGGGLDKKFNDRQHPKYADHGNAYSYAEKQGYRIVRTKDELLALKPSDGKILTCFTHGALWSAIESEAATQPSLKDLVVKATEMLDGEKGFFIMAEGGRIDWDGHRNDAAANVRDVLAMDEAVKAALEFKSRHEGETLVIVTGDHETGGMSMGAKDTGYAIYPERLAGQTMSAERFQIKIRDLVKKTPKLAFEQVIPEIVSAFGLELTDEKDVEVLKHAFEENPESLADACKRMVSAKSGVGWTSNVHTAMPLPTTASGAGAEQFSGYLDNTDIAKKIKAFYE